MEKTYFTQQESEELKDVFKNLIRLTQNVALPTDSKKLRNVIVKAINADHYGRDAFGLNTLVNNLKTAAALCEYISPDRNMVIAILLYNICKSEYLPEESISKDWGEDISKLIHGLLKISTIYSKSASVNSDNFRKLLLTFAEDIRVIIIMIIDRLILMRSINHHSNVDLVKEVAYEAAYLYAPLSHRLGLYKVKSELEDMSLKYMNRDMYTRIARKLNETKASRDAYITQFIHPIKQALEQHGLKFDIKGRTKSIYSIWNKMMKQNNDVEHIYDLFAIRIILDVPIEKERSECWLAYSVVTDMYQPNPARLKDWLSIPKSNGYESLHITVKGPASKWVEVQIRSRRMDEIAEKGIAAHWKYKGIKSENNLDTWMNHVRDILETADDGPMELMKNMKMDIYNKEVFVFTPKGDLYKLPLGASLLDFAFHVHSQLGCKCIGGKVDGSTRKLNYKLKSGDTVEIMTSSNQQPKMDWLNFVVTTKARNKIRQTIKEQENRASELGKEILQRRFKNRKIEIDEAVLSKLIKKLGYKTVTDFYNSVANETLDVNYIISEYESFESKVEAQSEVRSAEEFTLIQPEDAEPTEDVLVIGDHIKGINYKLAKCCNPIYGDDVFGFISSEGVIKIHRKDCPNASNICDRYPYRIITTRWSGKIGQQFGATLKIIGHDDIGIVTNITSIINKEKDMSLRSISIDSHDGIFQGYLVVGVINKDTLNNVIKKIKTIKGIKDVQRSN